jgi:hypothetical protein
VVGEPSGAAWRGPLHVSERGLLLLLQYVGRWWHSSEVLRETPSAAGSSLEVKKQLEERE